MSYKDRETLSPGTELDTDTLIAELKWDNNGLVAAIAQQYDSKDVLMLAWMNETALRETLQTGRACYWSRSRGKLWRKGEESGQVQLLKEIRIDCDGDTLLLLVDQTGPACHTGRRSCFYTRLYPEPAQILTAPLIDPATLYSK
ncbi:phosphoribosyl-AMP cyclohydrolase [Sulfurivirga caldicuralii]|uniref:Phosphoribosyl-AMP cyclohydrolase n=1 Tax=Sulfurivirga caldicuralii TaxID=364032 RepID=A0A1N6DJ28_9GAMM|nr:phosphoribosyl-AMP cyclohydrolase [Sulfurivirga caldicuralii]SIN70780.1 phosphoribosyl-AMP cyclohydrolase [Sulfurivirga caldicuralii]